MLFQTVCWNRFPLETHILLNPGGFCHIGIAEPDGLFMYPLYIGFVTGLETRAGTRVWVTRVWVWVGSEIPAKNPTRGMGVAGFCITIK